MITAKLNDDTVTVIANKPMHRRIDRARIIPVDDNLRYSAGIQIFA